METNNHLHFHLLKRSKKYFFTLTMFLFYITGAFAQLQVTFDSNGGSNVPPATGLNAGDLVSKPTDPTKPGLTFDAWYKEPAFNNPWNFDADVVNTDITLYARWTAEITFDSNGGSSVGPFMVEEGGKLPKPADPILSGLTFGGWYKEADFQNQWDFDNDTVAGNATLYARWTGMVTFYSAGTAIDSVTVTVGDTVPKPIDPTNGPFIFQGWHKNPIGGDPWNFDTDTVAGNMPLYAIWSTYGVIKFDSNGGTPIDSVIINVGDTVPQPTDPTNGNLIFNGWYKESDLQNEWNFSTDIVAGNATLYAQWNAIVTFEPNGGTDVEPDTVALGDQITPPADPTKQGLHFDAWYKEPALTNEWDFAVDSVTAATTLYAKWNAIVTFDPTGGSAVDPDTVPEGGMATKPADPILSGVVFEGWYKDTGLQNPWNFDTDIVISDTTLYAKWTNEASVIFESNGGTPVDSLTGITVGSVIPKPAPPTKPNLSFDGWYKEDALQNEWDFNTDTIEGNTTLYAKWDAVVTFESNSGSTVAQDTVTEGGVITQPADPTKPGLTFDAWYKEPAFENEWDFAIDSVTANITLYAKWNAIVTFDPNGGSTVNPDTVPEGSKVTKPANPTNGTLFFDGWYNDSGLVYPWDFDTDIVTSDTTLYAKWTTEATVAFNSNGGNPVDSITNLSMGAKIAQPADPTKQGLTFAGWYEESTFENTWNFLTDTISYNMTLYARWIAKITFDSNGGSEVPPIYANEGDTVTKPTDPVKEHFVFDGWYRDEALQNEWNFSSDTAMQDMTLYAKWADKLTVTFDSRGGTTVDPITDVTPGTTIAKPADPTKENAVFNGWYINDSTAWNFGMPGDTVKQNMTLYAHWLADIGSMRISEIGNQVHNGIPVEPKPTITDGNYILKEGVDYTLSYFNNNAQGTGLMIINGIGNYYGTHQMNFNITEYVAQYRLIIPQVDGIVTNPAAGTTLMWEGTRYFLEIHSLGRSSLTNMVVKMNGTVIRPDRELVEFDDNQIKVYDLGIAQHDITIEITGVVPYEPTNINDINDNEGIKIFTSENQLIVETNEPTDLRVYSISGQLYTSRHITEGRTSISMEKGVYIVNTGKKTTKVIVR